jgi:hypothetical protein
LHHLFKHILRGTYIAVEPFHLERYADEQAVQFNNRERIEWLGFLLFTPEQL